MDYEAFLKTKQFQNRSEGIRIARDDLHPIMEGFRGDIVEWACRKGRAAIFADTGLGKTTMQVEWARMMTLPGYTRALILAPLAVAKQTVRESADRLGVHVQYVRDQGEVGDSGIYITNYERVHLFDADLFSAVVLDESSILKSLDGKTRKLLTEMFASTPYRLCATATPAPNDVTELGRHAEFLGVMTNAEMLSAFFINDMKMKDGTYRLKKHAVKAFYKWLASWSIAVKRPSDLGYSDDGFILPALSIEVHTTASDYNPAGMLPGFHAGNVSAIEAKKIRHALVDDRAAYIAEMVNASDEAFVIWCDLNDESDAISALIPDSVNVYGSMSPEQKADAIVDFTTGKTRVLVTKGSIAGFGVNMQHCRNMVFCGLSYSWESYYQQIRRCWRFGQKNEVKVSIIISEQERGILDTIQNKEREAIKMTEELIKASTQYMRDELHNVSNQAWEYKTAEANGRGWRLMLGDSCERIYELAENSVDLSVFSPPFISLYTYTPTERDMGNSRSEQEFFAQFRLIIDGLLRITKPGRNCCVHVQQVALTKANDGVIGIKDFRGDVIRAFTQPVITRDMTADEVKAEFDRPKWIFHGEVTIDKNPQIQAIRTKTKGLMFAQLEKDSAANRPAFADYVLIFQKPGENEVAVKPECTREEWIQWAHPVWYNIDETNVLNTAVAKANEDERHICPLQLDLIERCIRLWSNRGDTVFSPFAGIGSELYSAVKLGRKGLGIELKPEYFNTAQKNLREAETASGQMDLFSWAAAQVEESAR